MTIVCTLIGAAVATVAGLGFVVLSAVLVPAEWFHDPDEWCLDCDGDREATSCDLCAADDRRRA